MEKFVLRGDDAAALRALEQQRRGGGAGDKQRMRQTTIVDGPKVVVEEMVQHLKDEMDAAKTTTNMLSILTALESEHYISLEMLEKTRIGVSLSRMQRRTESDEVRRRATQLLKVWKARAKKAMRRRAKRIETYGRNYGD